MSTKRTRKSCICPEESKEVNFSLNLTSSNPLLWSLCVDYGGSGSAVNMGHFMLVCFIWFVLYFMFCTIHAAILLAPGNNRRLVETHLDENGNTWTTINLPINGVIGVWKPVPGAPVAEAARGLCCIRLIYSEEAPLN